MVISFERYAAGDVPVRVENWCEDVVIKLRQQTSNQVTRDAAVFTASDGVFHQLLV